MNLNDFIKGKKWVITISAIFLVVLAIIAGIFSYGIDSKSKFNTLKDQVDQLSNAVSLLENSSPDIKSTIDGINQKIDTMREKMDEISQKTDISNTDQLVESELQSKLDEIVKCLSELNKQLESIRITGESAIQPAKSMEEPAIEQETITVTAVAETDEETVAEPDSSVSDSLAVSENQAQASDIIKAGQDFTVAVKANEVSNLYGYQFNLNYDNSKAAYKGNLKSAVSEISTIFKKDMNDHLLVGATMIGNTPGYSGQNETICTMVFTAIDDFDLSIFTISNVNIVDADQNYIENNDGWSIDVKAES